VGGAIPSGATVLVDYELGPEPANVIDSMTTAASVRYGITQGNLAGLSVFAAYQRVDQDLDTRDPSAFVISDTSQLRYGVEYFLRGLTLLAEQEIYESDIAPYDLWRVQARYSRRLGLSSMLNLSASYERVDFDMPDNDVELTRLTGEWVQRITPELNIRLWVNFRDENDRISPDSRGFEQALEVRWHRRQTDVFATLSNSMVESANEDNQFQSITFGIRRAF
jgi:hypothetical protein